MLRLRRAGSVLIWLILVEYSCQKTRIVHFEPFEISKYDCVHVRVFKCCFDSFLKLQIYSIFSHYLVKLRT